VVKGLAKALPLNGQITGESFARFAVYFVPACYVFAISEQRVDKPLLSLPAQ
jgi:hypothetical protein